MMPFIVMTASIVIIFLIIIGRGHARPDSTPRRPASAACGCTRQDRGAFAALQGLSGTVACLGTTARSVDKDKAARRSQPIVAWAMTWSLPMAVADRCRWPLPIVQLLLVGHPAVDIDARRSTVVLGGNRGHEVLPFTRERLSVVVQALCWTNPS